MAHNLIQLKFVSGYWRCIHDKFGWQLEWYNTIDDIGGLYNGCTVCDLSGLTASEYGELKELIAEKYPNFPVNKLQTIVNKFAL